MIGISRQHLEAWGVTLLAVVFAWTWSLTNGRDINWDFLNYHLYAGFAADGGRLSQDYFPASIQSYLPGFVYVPLYAAIQANWDAWAVQILLGSMGVPAVWAVWLLARRLVPEEAGAAGIGWRMLMVVVACSSPMFIVELGTSFADLPTAALVLFSLVLALPRSPDRPMGSPMAAGIFVGLACALKMSNVPMSVGVGLVCWFVARPGARLKICLRFVAGGALAFLFAYGYWGWHLYQRFGNPFFPLFLNQWIGSDEFAHTSVVLKRFIPMSFTDLVMRPLYMLDPVPGIYVETRAPDARYLALIGMVVAWIVARWRTGLRLDRLEIALLAWVGVTWVFWLVTSGNGRYAIPLAMTAGVVVVAFARKFWSLRYPSVVGLKTLFLIFLAVQTIFMGMSTTFRWDGRESPDQTYFNPAVPDHLKAQPHVIVSLNTQSVAWLAPFVHPQSVFTAPAGQYVFGPESMAGKQLASLFDNGLPVLVTIADPIGGAGVDNPKPIEAHVARLFGLNLDMRRCVRVNLGQINRFDLDEATGLAKVATPGFNLCQASYDAQTSVQAQAQIKQVNDIFNLIEDSCPKVLSPMRQQTVCFGATCVRRYVNTDITMILAEDGAVTARMFGTIQPVLVGQSDKLRAGTSPRCPGAVTYYIPFSAGDGVIARQH